MAFGRKEAEIERLLGETAELEGQLQKLAPYIPIAEDIYSRVQTLLGADTALAEDGDIPAFGGDIDALFQAAIDSVLADHLKEVRNSVYAKLLEKKKEELREGAEEKILATEGDELFAAVDEELASLRDDIFVQARADARKDIREQEIAKLTRAAKSDIDLDELTEQVRAEIEAEGVVERMRDEAEGQKKDELRPGIIDEIAREVKQQIEDNLDPLIEEVRAAYLASPEAEQKRKEIREELKGEVDEMSYPELISELTQEQRAELVRVRIRAEFDQTMFELRMQEIVKHSKRTGHIPFHMLELDDVLEVEFGNSGSAEERKLAKTEERHGETIEVEPKHPEALRSIKFRVLDPETGTVQVIHDSWTTSGDDMHRSESLGNNTAVNIFTCINAGADSKDVRSEIVLGSELAIVYGSDDKTPPYEVVWAYINGRDTL